MRVAELLMLSLVFGSVCGLGMGIIATVCLDGLDVKEAEYMKYGVCIQIWGFLFLCLLHIGFGEDIFLLMMPMFTLLGAGIFMLGAISVIKAMKYARVSFAIMSVGIQACVVLFFTQVVSWMFAY